MSTVEFLMVIVALVAAMYGTHLYINYIELENNKSEPLKLMEYLLKNGSITRIELVKMYGGNSATGMIRNLERHGVLFEKVSLRKGIYKLKHVPGTLAVKDGILISNQNNKYKREIEYYLLQK